jgi:hypothetical protein
MEETGNDLEMDTMLDKIYNEVSEKADTTIVEGEMSHAARELTLHADNDQHLHNTSHEPIVNNLRLKAKKGTYDHTKANKLWQYHADRAAHSYAQQHGDKSTPWHKMFSVADRKQAASHFADRAKEEIGLKEETNIAEDSVAMSSLHPNSRPGDKMSKIAMMQQAVGAMGAMNKTDMTDWFTKAMALIGHEADHIPSGASASNQSSVDMKTGKGPKTKDAMPKIDHKNNPLATISVKEDVEEMFDGQDLSEEFKEKATTIFEAAVNARATLEIVRLEEEYNTRLEEEVSEIIETLEDKVNDYMDYVVENWMEENSVAIESTLRSEIAEDFISNLKNLFTEHYIDVPQDKVNVIEELANKVDELESRLDETISENVELKNFVIESERVNTISDMCEGLTLSQTEKFEALAEGIVFDGDIDAYKKKLSYVKENYFPKSSKKTTNNIEEETFESDESGVVSSNPEVSAYVNAISRIAKK